MPTAPRDELKDPWCRALLDCSTGLRNNDLDTCLAYLVVLERGLERENIVLGGSSVLEQVPSSSTTTTKMPNNYPPMRWKDFQTLYENCQNLEHCIRKAGTMPSKAIKPRYHPFRLLGPNLWTRLWIAQASVQVSKAAHMAQDRGDWKEFSRAYEVATTTLQRALDATEAATSKWWDRWQEGGASIQFEQELLARDAQRLVDELEWLVGQRNELLQDAECEESFWSHQKEHSNNLQHVQEALCLLTAYDPSEALQTAQRLKEELVTNQRKSADVDRLLGEEPAEMRTLFQNHNHHAHSQQEPWRQPPQEPTISKQSLLPWRKLSPPRPRDHETTSTDAVRY